MRALIVVSCLVATALSATRAQTVETPIAFDSAGRILNVNDALAARLGLTPPGWPVGGSYAEARLYQVSDGTFVIVVHRPNGANDRFSLTPEQFRSLRQAFSEATTRVGRLVAEDAASLVEEQARRPFVRDQTLLAMVMYGPALASLTDDATFGTATYLGAVGATFFTLSNATQNLSVTKAQNSMSTDGALRGFGLLSATLAATGTRFGDHGVALTALGGGIGGSIIGFQRGKGLTSSEAQASMTGSTLAAGTLIGLAGTAGLLENGRSNARTANGALVVGGIAGYLLGPAYPRQASYTVTAGDISIVKLGAILGVGAALTPIVGASNLDGKVVAGFATAGWIGGAIVADRLAAMPFNHSLSDSHMVYFGAFGGALLGSVPPVLAKSDNRSFSLGSVTIGAIVGAVAAQRMMSPRLEGEATSPEHGAPSSARNWNLSFDPQGAMMTLTKQRGTHSLVQITF